MKIEVGASPWPRLLRQCQRDLSDSDIELKSPRYLNLIIVLSACPVICRSAWYAILGALRPGFRDEALTGYQLALNLSGVCRY